ncbi:VanW family protein [Paenibacillus koleovorans]|uniref:VanW family protein n=1 Tax=Paenibacillus koleovorans TaxID=121608 RepID=UPI001FE819BC|nr:VanW family protein [Paenibacillus koleovorans]
MRWSWRSVNRVLIICIVVWGSAFGALAAYAWRDSFPAGLVWGDWQLGGMREEAFRAELDRRVQALLANRVRFELPAGGSTDAVGSASAAGSDSSPMATAGARGAVSSASAAGNALATGVGGANAAGSSGSPVATASTRGAAVNAQAGGSTTGGTLPTQSASNAQAGSGSASRALPAASTTRGDAQAIAQGAAGTFSLAELGLSVDASRLEAAAERLFRGSLLGRARARWSLRHASVPLELLIDRIAALRAVGTLWPQLLQAHPLDARRVITPDDRVGYVPGRAADQIDADALILGLGQAAEERFGALPTGPSGHGNPELITASAPASASTSAALRPKPLANSNEPIVLLVPITTIQPTVTVDTLRAEGIDRKIAEFTTFFPISGEGRKHNIRSTAQTVHDMVLKPNEEFDYNRIIRQTEKQFGYKEAPVILNGKLVPGVGGGICQVSTTLYNAVLRAGLQITERRNHSLPVSYIPLGQDATFADGWINFRFRNNTGSHLLIRTDVTETGITVKLFGRMPDTMTYEIFSNTLETIAPPVKVVVNPTLAPGQESLIQEGKPGYIVETYRIRKRNGVEEARELISKDTYQAQPTLVARNKTNEDPAKPPAKPTPVPEKRILLEDGVSGPTFKSFQ